MAEKYNRKYLEKVARKVLDGKASAAEKLFLDEYYAAFDKEENISGKLTAHEKTRIGEDIKSSLLRHLDLPQNIVPFYRRRLIRTIGIAASICIPLMVIGYFITHKKVEQQIARVNDIGPGSNKAILVLSNGKRISVNDATNGTLARQGAATITKSVNGRLVYSVSANNETILAYNTLITPRGGQNYVKLADGTEVWLDAASSLKFPTSFNGSKRLVELTGEAYFKVAHNAKQPFMVRAAGEVVNDIGTEFNINAYTDEPSVKTTLITGAVEVSLEIGKKKKLEPGQQTIFAGNDLRVTTADIDEAVAWKNGQFVFNDETLESVMRKVSRWYDVDIEYQDKALKDAAFGGSISRFSNVSKVLHMLELTGLAKFKIEQHKIIVFK